jgi:hypothetical protein
MIFFIFAKIVQMEKKIPNPFGKKGSLKHQEKTQEIADEIERNNLVPKRELEIVTPAGKKKKRFVDVAALDLKKSVVALYQVGKTKKNGSPVKREAEAIEDIETAVNLKVNFCNFN